MELYSYLAITYLFAIYVLGSNYISAWIPVKRSLEKPQKLCIEIDFYKSKSQGILKRVTKVVLPKLVSVLGLLIP